MQCLLVLAALGLAAASPLHSQAAVQNFTERHCGCSMNKMWLDIVLVIDSSDSMSNAGLAEIMAHATTLLGSNTISQAHGQYTRVGIVMVGKNARQVADLNKFQSVGDFMGTIYSAPYLGDKQLDLEAGLLMASNLLLDQSRGPNRANVKTAIVLYSSAYSSGSLTDPLHIATNIKESGHAIITVAFMQFFEGSDALKLAALASPGFAFTSKSAMNDIQQALCQVNCFCKQNWHQFTSSYYQPGVNKFGSCLWYSDIAAGWIPAYYACQRMDPLGHLAYELDSTKHQFMIDLMRNDTTTTDKNGAFHIGLSLDEQKKTYVWKGPGSTETTLSSASFRNWAAGYPAQTIGDCITNTHQSNGFFKWQNENCYSTATRYVCEMVTCDTDNYCASV